MSHNRHIKNSVNIFLCGLDIPKFGILIARGDLAVEIGFENLALAQEDILCLCEAAHTPVILATQVLETLAKSGLPTRAECVMLDKGKHILEAAKIIKKRQIFRDFTSQDGIFDT